MRKAIRRIDVLWRVECLSVAHVLYSAAFQYTLKSGFNLNVPLRTAKEIALAPYRYFVIRNQSGAFEFSPFPLDPFL